MSWTFVPSLVGIMLLTFGVVSIIEGYPTQGAVQLVLGIGFMALWVWMIKREARR